MAARRMVSTKVIDTDMFLDLPATARLLYYDLIMRADDDGFVDSPKKIMRATGARQDDLSILVAKQYVLPMEDGVVVIKHWRIHNYIKGDRYTPTIYTEQKDMLTVADNKEYNLRGAEPLQLPEPETEEPKPKKPKKEDVGAAIAEFAAAHPDVTGLQQALTDFAQYRKERKKPLTMLSLSKLCDKLADEIDPADWVAAINSSIANGWQGIFPMKGGNGNDSNKRSGPAQTVHRYTVDGSL